MTKSFFSRGLSPLVGRNIQLETRKRRKIVKLPKYGIFCHRSSPLPTLVALKSISVLDRLS